MRECRLLLLDEFTLSQQHIQILFNFYRSDGMQVSFEVIGNPRYNTTQIAARVEGK